MCTFYILIIVMSVVSLASTSHSDWCDIIVNEITNNRDIHQVTIFTKEKTYVNTSLIDNIFKKLLSRVPLLSINVIEAETTDKNRLLTLPVFLNPRMTTLYVVLQSQHRSCLQEMWSTLDLFVELAPVPMRPKCLVVFFDNVDATTVDLRGILSYAWSLKFLDFAILEVNSNGNSVILDYNPFTKVHRAKAIGSAEPLFPDKLHDMMGYSIHTLVFNKPPYVQVNITNLGTIADGLHYIFISELSKYLNYTIDLGKKEPNTFGVLMRKLENSEINITPMKIFVGSALYGRNILIGRILLQDGMKMAVPILRIYKISNLLEISVHLCYSVIILLVISIAVKLLKFATNTWSAFYIFQILIGVPVTRQPQRRIEMPVFLTVALISLKYSMDTIGLLTDTKMLTNNEVSFHALKELNNPSMPIYINKIFLRTIIKSETYDLMEILKQKAIGVDEVTNCFKRLIEERDCICLAPRLYGKHLINTNRNPDKSAIMKIAEPTIFYDFQAFGYEKGSPFVEKFNAGFQKFLESGIWNKWEKERAIVEAKPDVLINEGADVVQLVIVLLMGYTVALFAFILELFKLL